MAPKSIPPAAKQAIILSWFQKSAVAHSIKDLEKSLPTVASISSIQVKDYLQALSEDNKIRVEKIGSGNWYWSFPIEIENSKKINIHRNEEERDKLKLAVASLSQRTMDARTALTTDGGTIIHTDCQRHQLITRHDILASELDMLQREIVEYNYNDPLEIKKVLHDVELEHLSAERWTEHIQSMESWFKCRLHNDRLHMEQLKRNYYGDEFDSEEQCLKEL